MQSDSEAQQLVALVDGDQAPGFEQRVARIERRVGALADRRMRRAVIMEQVDQLGGTELVALMVHLLRRSRSGQTPARRVVQEMALEPTVYSALPYDRVQDAYRVARQTGQHAVASLFLSSPALTNPTIDEAFTGNQHLDLPVGVRRSAARMSDRFQLDRLLHDRDHRVIRILLGNPRLTERDVVKIAAMRPTRPEVLLEVARHPRWASRYRVRTALAANPHTPAAMVRRLLPTLMRQDLRGIADALPTGLADEARALLARPPGAPIDPPAQGEE